MQNTATGAGLNIDSDQISEKSFHLVGLYQLLGPVSVLKCNAVVVFLHSSDGIHAPCLYLNWPPSLLSIIFLSINFSFPGMHMFREKYNMVLRVGRCAGPVVICAKTLQSIVWICWQMWHYCTVTYNKCCMCTCDQNLRQSFERFIFVYNKL